MRSGPALAVTVLIAMLVSLTLAPALIASSETSCPGPDPAGTGARRAARTARRDAAAGRPAPPCSPPRGISGSGLPDGTVSLPPC